MSNVARVFDQQTNALRRLPIEVGQQDNGNLPWATVAHNTMPPMMFQLRFSDGKLVSFAYSDLREIHCRDAGCVELFLQAMCKLVITIEGRHLRDLAKWFSGGMVQWVEEGDPRDLEKPETAPEVVKITIEEIAE